jgi:hypothetical protein
MTTEKQSIWVRMQRVDPRIIYTLLLLSIILPMIKPSIKFPIVPSQQSIDFYNGINKVAETTPNKLIIVDGWWSAGTRGEQKWQTQAILTHLMRKHLKFALLSFDTQNKTLMPQIADQLAPKYGYVYGKDYINWGYNPVFQQTVKGLVTDIPGTIKTDFKSRPLSQFPIMNGVKTSADIGAVIDITPVSSLEVWIGLFQGAHKTPFFYAPTAVMAPQGFPFLDSGQVSGLLTGIKGAGDYEKQLGMSSFGTQATTALSFVYALIILLVIVGNIGYFKERHDRRAR